ncbi:hypothetical protein C1H76_8724 [Elsinoe australis]|uniref:Uncharacterized protein n=1 Tax=Elsinoe australis TaxID=40998 RepID=A0A4U7ARQ2_9PEZI|nr:hypothetical protein C1H76_8724 [Elsinoe australis]
MRRLPSSTLPLPLPSTPPPTASLMASLTAAPITAAEAILASGPPLAPNFGAVFDTVSNPAHNTAPHLDLDATLGPATDLAFDVTSLLRPHQPSAPGSAL